MDPSTAASSPLFQLLLSSYWDTRDNASDDGINEKLGVNNTKLNTERWQHRSFELQVPEKKHVLLPGK